MVAGVVPVPVDYDRQPDVHWNAKQHTTPNARVFCPTKEKGYGIGYRSTVGSEVFGDSCAEAGG